MWLSAWTLTAIPISTAATAIGAGRRRSCWRRMAPRSSSGAATFLQAIIDDPSPGPSVAPPVVIAEGSGLRLTSRQRAAALQNYHGSYDDQHGGWSDVHKFIDAAALELAYSEGDAGDMAALRRARPNLDANLRL